MILLFIVIQYSSPNLSRIEFFDQHQIIVVVIIKVETCSIKIARLSYHQYLIIAIEIANIFSTFVNIEAQHIAVEIDISTTKRRATFLFQHNLRHIKFSKNITHRITPLDSYFREVFFESQILDTACSRLQLYLDNLSLAIRVGREIYHLRARGALCQVVLLIASYCTHSKAFNIIAFILTIAIYGIVDSAFVILSPHTYVQYILAHIDLISHLNHLIFTIFVEDDNIVHVRAIGYELGVFVFLQSDTHKSLFGVDIEFFVSFNHLSNLDCFEIAQFGLTGI